MNTLCLEIGPAKWLGFEALTCSPVFLRPIPITAVLVRGTQVIIRSHHGSRCQLGAHETHRGSTNPPSKPYRKHASRTLLLLFQTHFKSQLRASRVRDTSVDMAGN